MNNRVFSGEVLNHIAAAAISSGDVIEFGTDAAGFIGIAGDDIASGDTGPVAVAGVFELTKVTGASTGGAQGTPVYVNGSGELTAVAGSDHLAGVWAETSADNDAIGRVLLAVNAV